MMLYLSIYTHMAQAVGALWRYLSAPTEDHWRLALGILRYLAGTATMGITFGAGNLKVKGGNGAAPLHCARTLSSAFLYACFNLWNTPTTAIDPSS